MHYHEGVPNKTARYFYLVCKYIFICCVPNFWYKPLNWPKTISRAIEKLSPLLDLVIASVVISEILAPLTQKSDLTQKQVNNQRVFIIANSMMITGFFVPVHFYKQKLKSLVKNLSISLKAVYNDEKVERQMIKTSKLFMGSYAVYLYITVIFYGLDGLIEVVTKDATFTTIIPAWPDTQDLTPLAGIMRVFIYICWLLFVMRTSAIYLLALVLLIGLSHQYKNLQSYFLSLNNIFEKNSDQKVKEEEYEKAVKIGILLHARTLSCTKDAQETFKVLFSGQILLNFWVMVLVMVQLTSTERSITNTVTALFTAVAVLFTTGMFMWNAGDITVEASRIPEAIFASGWQNCYGSNGHRIRKILTLALAQGQIPVVIRVLGVIDLSYASYLSIVKTSYSVFSVLY